MPYGFGKNAPASCEAGAPSTQKTLQYAVIPCSSKQPDLLRE